MSDVCKLEVKKEVEEMKFQLLSPQDNPQQIIALPQLNPLYQMRYLQYLNNIFKLEIPVKYTLSKDGR